MPFNHDAHLALAFTEIRLRGAETAALTLCEQLRSAAIDAGKPEKFNATLTVCWVVLVADAMAGIPEAVTFEQLRAAVPALSDKNLPLRYYSPELLNSDGARRRFVPADRQTLPAIMPASQNTVRLALVPALERATHAVALHLQSNDAVSCSQAEANVLAFLHAHRHASLSDVHTAFGHRRSTLTSVVDRLEQHGLVLRERDPDDGRAFVLALTGAGAAKARLIVQHVGKLEASVQRRAKKSDIEAFLRVAQAIVQAATPN